MIRIYPPETPTQSATVTLDSGADHCGLVPLDQLLKTKFNKTKENSGSNVSRPLYSLTGAKTKIGGSRQSGNCRGYLKGESRMILTQEQVEQNRKVTGFSLCADCRKLLRPGYDVIENEISQTESVRVSDGYCQECFDKRMGKARRA